MLLNFTNRRSFGTGSNYRKANNKINCTERVFVIAGPFPPKMEKDHYLKTLNIWPHPYVGVAQLNEPLFHCCVLNSVRKRTIRVCHLSRVSNTDPY
jgi:hypothetical protein